VSVAPRTRLNAIWIAFLILLSLGTSCSDDGETPFACFVADFYLVYKDVHVSSDDHDQWPRLTNGSVLHSFPADTSGSSADTLWQTVILMVKPRPRGGYPTPEIRGSVRGEVSFENCLACTLGPSGAEIRSFSCSIHYSAWGRLGLKTARPDTLEFTDVSLQICCCDLPDCTCDKWCSGESFGWTDPVHFTVIDTLSRTEPES